MKTQKYIEIAAASIKALTSNKLRTFLTTLGIIIGIMAVITLLNIGQGAQKSITDSINSLGSNQLTVIAGSVNLNNPLGIIEAKKFTIDDVEALRDTKKNYYSEAAGMSTKPYTVMRNNVNMSVTVGGIMGDYGFVRDIEIGAGRKISDEDGKSLARVAVLGSEVAKKLYSNENPIGQKIKLGNINLTIIGVTVSQGGGIVSNPDEFVYIPLQTFQKVLTGVDSVAAIYVKAKDSDTTSFAEQEVTIKLRQFRQLKADDENDFTIRNSSQLLGTLNQVTSIFTAFLSTIGGISLLVSGIGIMNIMFVTVRERTREIGLRKSIGATNNDILFQFLAEAVAITFLGGIIGTILGILLSFLIASVAGFAFVLSFESIFLAVGVSGGIGLLFGIYPARNAARLNPIEALRFE